MSEPPAQHPGGEWRPLADQIAVNVKNFIDGVDALARRRRRRDGTAAAARGIPDPARRGPARRQPGRDPAGQLGAGGGRRPRPRRAAHRPGRAAVRGRRVRRGVRPVQGHLVPAVPDLGRHRGRGRRPHPRPQALPGRAGRSRRCGGGSTATSTTGVPTAGPRCAPCTPWSRTPAWTSPRRAPARDDCEVTPARSDKINRPSTTRGGAARPWRSSCRSTAVLRLPTRMASSGSRSGSWPPARPVTRLWWSYPRWATRPTSSWTWPARSARCRPRVSSTCC